VCDTIMITVKTARDLKACKHEHNSKRSRPFQPVRARHVTGVHHHRCRPWCRELRQLQVVVHLPLTRLLYTCTHTTVAEGMTVTFAWRERTATSSRLLRQQAPKARMVLLAFKSQRCGRFGTRPFSGSAAQRHSYEWDLKMWASCASGALQLEIADGTQPVSHFASMKPFPWGCRQGQPLTAQ
jgi:hypothetical protein